MNLPEFIATQGGSGTLGCPVLAKIAQLAGCKSSTLYMISRGHKQPSWRLAASISRATEGAVTLPDLRADAADLMGAVGPGVAGAA